MLKVARIETLLAIGVALATWNPPRKLPMHPFRHQAPRRKRVLNEVTSEEGRGLTLQARAAEIREAGLSANAAGVNS